MLATPLLNQMLAEADTVDVSLLPRGRTWQQLRPLWLKYTRRPCQPMTGKQAVAYIRQRTSQLGSPQLTTEEEAGKFHTAMRAADCRERMRRSEKGEVKN